MKSLKIETDGTMELVEITGETIDEQNDEIWKILGGYFDIVNMPYAAVMLVNDEGFLDNLPLNHKAAQIAGYPALAGVALIFGTEDTDDGAIFTDCPDYYADFA